jgi:DnaK suppressor protein
MYAPAWTVGNRRDGGTGRVEQALLEQFRRELLALKAELQAQEEQGAEDARPVELDQARVGRLSRMDALQAQAMAQEATRRRQRRLAAVEGAIARIGTGDYGFCFACGEEIDVRRLHTDPTSTRCIRCAE